MVPFELKRRDGVEIGGSNPPPVTDPPPARPKVVKTQWQGETERLAFQAEIYQHVAWMEAMKATNSERQSNGCGIAYDELSFYHVSEKLRKIAERLREDLS